MNMLQSLLSQIYSSHQYMLCDTSKDKETGIFPDAFKPFKLLKLPRLELLLIMT